MRVACRAHHTAALHPCTCQSSALTLHLRLISLGPAQDKRAYKIGLDFGINLGDQVNESAALNTQTGQTCDVTGVKTKVFTLSK